MKPEDSPAEAPTIESPGSAGAKDSFDELLVKIVRPAAPELAVGTVIDERFRIERVLGSGGMGTVYAARDRSLDRDVAIKVHHAEGGATRLRREAIAMARLAHPNVVTVFEVGELDRRPYVVMELVAGTLRSWLGEVPRDNRAIVAMLVAAGEGLQAAHAAGLVHRDFKPENVLIDTGGRPRVGDFGLARGLDSQDETPRAPPTELLAPMTQTGAVLGTPAYMAPEQITGSAVDARADQFAFCVTAWEALYGRRPFAGATLAQLEAAIASGTRSEPPAGSGVPAQVRAALERGLAKEPADRFGSMAELLEALRPRRARKRWLIASAGVAVVGAGVAFALTRGESARAMCGRAGERMAGVWDDARRSAMAAGFERSRRPGAGDTFRRVAERLDRHAADLTDARVAACEATNVRGEQSPQLLDLRVRCLDRRLGEMRALVDVLAEGGADVVDHAVEAASRLGSPARCADAAALTREVPLPDDHARIDILQRVADDVAARVAAGRYAEALPLAEQLDRDAASIAYAPLRARAGAIHADLLHELGRDAEAEPVWYAALHQASAARDDRLALTVWRGLIEAHTGASRLAGADVLVESALATAERLDANEPGRALLDSTLAELRIQQGKYADALALARRARNWFAAHEPGSLDAASAVRIVAYAEESSGDFAAALESNAKAIAAMTPMLGADHPTVARLHQERARILSSLTRLPEARAELANLVGPIEKAYGPSPLLAELYYVMGEIDRKMAHTADATADYERALAMFEHGGNDIDRAKVSIGLGVVAQDAGSVERARDYFARAKAAAEHALPESEKLLPGILIYHAGLLTDLHAAHDELERALEISTRVFGADASYVGEVLNALGVNETYLGDHAKAMEHLRRAIANGEKSLGPDALDTIIAHFSLGVDLADQGKYADALAEHERALAAFERVLGKEHPTLAAPLSLLALEYAAVGRAADGIAAAERGHAIRAARKEPDDAALRFGWGAALWAAGKDRVRAVELVQGAVADWKREPDDPAMLARAEAWLAGRR